MLRGEIEPLARDVEQVERPRQFAGGGAQPVAARCELPAHDVAVARALILDIGDELGAHRHGGLGRRGGRGRAEVGGVIDERGVGLVADAGDDRDAARGDRAHDDLLVEAPQILDRAAAARDDQQVGARHRAVLGAAR